MSAIIISTVHGKCLPVLAASITCYLPTDFVVYLSGSDIVFPRHQTINSANTATNFGDAYNNVVNQAWADGHEDVLVCNDDVVFTPHFWAQMVEDLKIIPSDNRGWVAARSDYARGRQNIRWSDEPCTGLKNPVEDHILRANIIAPIVGYISKDAWIDFPPINWFSDDVQCLDMNDHGYQHYISRAYVHHVGSQTCGFNFDKCIEDARPWLEQNRPDLAKKWLPTF